MVIIHLVESAWCDTAMANMVTLGVVGGIYWATDCDSLLCMERGGGFGYYRLDNPLSGMDGGEMSLVTNVILLTGVSENDGIADLNETLKKTELTGWRLGVDFCAVDEAISSNSGIAGTKNLECGIYVGAFNYLVLQELVTAINATSWDEPGEVQLLVKEQEDSTFRFVPLDVRQEESLRSRSWYDPTQKTATVADYKEEER